MQVHAESCDSPQMSHVDAQQHEVALLRGADRWVVGGQRRRDPTGREQAGKPDTLGILAHRNLSRALRPISDWSNPSSALPLDKKQLVERGTA